MARPAGLFREPLFDSGCKVVVVEMGESVAEEATGLPQGSGTSFIPQARAGGYKHFLGARAAGAARGNQETMPIRTIGPVGCGMPPAGSSVTWNHFGGIPSGTFIIQ